MPSNDREMWKAISGQKASSAEVNYLTYAIYAFEKYDWVQSFETSNGTPPSAQDTDNWITQITDHRIAVWRDSAVRFFDGAARAYLATEIERQKKDAVDQSILNEIRNRDQVIFAELRKASVWYKQIGVALVTAILAPLIIGALIVAARAYDLFMPTSTGVSNKLETHSGGGTHQPGPPAKKIDR